MCLLAKGHLAIKIRSCLDNNFDKTYYNIEIEAVVAMIDSCKCTASGSIEYCMQIVDYIDLTTNDKALGVPFLENYFKIKFGN